jgi:hypothetical protein
MRYVAPETVKLIPDAQIQREPVFRDMRAMYTLLPACYMEKWYPETVEPPKPKFEPVKGFWLTLPARALVWAAVAALAVLHRRKWRDEAVYQGLIKHA